MDAPPTPAWPRSAQLATAFLGGLATALLTVHVTGGLRWGGRPTELDRGGPAYRIDLNRADRAELLQLPGVGDHLAARIEAYRQEHGPFQDVGDLLQVHGVGPATVERLRYWVCVGGVREDLRPASPAAGGRKRTASRKADALTGSVDINRATLAELQRLPGVGPKMAQRIVEARRTAPFRSVEDLRRVPGIGPKTLERLRPHVTVGAEPERVAVAG